MRPFANLTFEEAQTDNPDYGKFTLTPLERGFGITIGNAMRRVLLSSIPGASVFAVSIENARHEFTSLDGVEEDVTAIILNLKSLVLKIDSADEDSVRVLSLDQVGPKTVTAGDLVCPSDVEVINPDLPIAHLAEGGHLQMTVQANKGRGYFTNEANKRITNFPIGTIPTDSNYSPIVKVNFSVEPTRVEHDTDYDKLVLEVWTNGALTPHEAVSLAAKILIAHLESFGNLADQSKSMEVFDNKPDASKNKLEDMTIEELDLSVRSYNCLKRAAISTVSELCSKSEEEMMKVRNLGKKSLKEVKDKLESMGLHFRNAK
ncbi:MAG: DNA-directed RNA polymerase subunit alpha [Bacilli bacterium]|jgi:DNA-directed RNA polymerase subunit alpha|nr:DNA-directed RNA polymerase subunit alpha [Bacilli bacterium]